MDLLTIILIAIGFAMQAFAFSTANGIIANSKDEGLLALTPVFGGFQMLTPEIGELVGLSYKKKNNEVCTSGRYSSVLDKNS